MAKKYERKMEVYCRRTSTGQRNPLVNKRDMILASSCLVGTEEFGKPTGSYEGFGTVKVIPVPKEVLEGIFKGSKARARRLKRK